MRIAATTFVSVDGVMQGPGSPDEDRSGGFDRGGWVMPLFDDDAGRFINEVFDAADAFLLGRRTYEIFAAYWPAVTDPNDPIASRLNTLPKYVVSTTLRSADWTNTTIINGDVPRELRRLKELPGREIQVHGSGTVVRTLLENDLLDELRLLVFPVILGAGRHLSPTRAWPPPHCAWSTHAPRVAA